jgi:REP element-mobilizing transposase RayT
MKHPMRKSPRLSYFDYSRNGAYFITICTQDRKHLFGTVGADSISARIVEKTFLETIQKYPAVNCPKYVVMPNHFHAIITIIRADMESAPTISEVIQSFKRYSTLEYIKSVKNHVLPPFEKRIWQRSYHDHIIRGETDYIKIWEYIENNPRTWENDCFYDENPSNNEK